MKWYLSGLLVLLVLAGCDSGSNSDNLKSSTDPIQSGTDLAQAIPQMGPMAHEEIKDSSFYYGFEISKVVLGMKMRNPIKRGNSLSPAEVAGRKREFLDRPEVTDIGFHKLRDYFDDFFPRSWWSGENSPRIETDPMYFDPSLFVDFSKTGEDGLPIPFEPDNAIYLARKAIDSAVSYADSSLYLNSDWHLDLRYYLKRVLVELEKSGDIERKKLTIRVMVSVGLHCGPGNMQGAQVLKDLLFPGDEFGTESQSTKELVLATLNGMREEIFNRVSDFVKDDHTAHTKIYYRNLMSDTLSIVSGPTDDPHQWAARRPIDHDEFKKKFFEGQVGNPKSEDIEEQRSYQGYTRENVVRKVIDLFQDSQFITNYYNEVHNALDDSAAVAWGKQHTREVLNPIDYFDPEDEDGNIAWIDDPSMLGQIKDAYFRDFFLRENGELKLTTNGLRQALIDFEVFETSSGDDLDRTG